MRPLMARLMGMLLIVGAVLLSASGPAAACSCAPPDLRADLFAESDAVFIGEIEEIRRPGFLAISDQTARYVFAVDTVFRGDVYARQSVVTHAETPACGMEISGPGRFLIFASSTGQGGPTPEAGEFASSLCSGNALVGPDFTSDEFGDGFAPLAGSSPNVGAGLAWFVWAGVLAGVVAVMVGGSAAVWSVRRRRRLASAH